MGFIVNINCLRGLALVLTFIGLTTSGPLFAQSGVGAISGVIHDPSGAVIPTVKITVTNTATNVSLTVITGEAGDFTVPNLPVGEYRVRVEKEGFKPVAVEHIPVNASTDVRTAGRRFGSDD
jgi:hypothetical protein